MSHDNQCTRNQREKSPERELSSTTPSSSISFPHYNGREKCTWSATTTEPCPHGTLPNTSSLKSRSSIMKSALEAIGETPLISCSRIAKEENVKCQLLGKCEFFNAGGSIKDRAAVRMIMEAENKKILKDGDIIIEPTSGNMGMGLCLASAIKGYKVIITMPEKMSGEKVNLMKALGAEIVRTPTEAVWNTAESHIGVALRLKSELDNSHILDQYKNIANPLSHYEWTAQEIVEQCGGELPDAIIISAGTGGTITGVARKFREISLKTGKKVLVVGVDPEGSILAQPDSINENPKVTSYEVEGIGYDFIPSVLDRSIVDEWIKVDDEESFVLARKLIRYEGLLVGGSSGSALAGALKFIRNKKWENDPSKRVVIIYPDGARNYMSKFIDNAWLYDRGIDIEKILKKEDQRIEGFEEFKPSTDFGQWTVDSLPLKPAVSINDNETCRSAAKVMMENKVSQLTVVDSKTKALVGVITDSAISTKYFDGRCTGDDSLSKVLTKKCVTIDKKCSLLKLTKHFDCNTNLVVVESKGKEQIPVSTINKMDVVSFLMSKK